MNLTAIDRPIIIYGNGSLLNGKGYSRIFNITVSNVTFVNVRFADGKASGQFGDNVSMGGAIFWAGEYGNIIDSRFFYIFAVRGGAIYYNASA